MGKYYSVSFGSQDRSLIHYGIQGQKWGIRRFQYENGSYTPEGKERYGRGQNKLDKQHKTEAILAIENDASAYKTSSEKLKVLTSDCFDFSPKNLKEQSNKERADRAVELGLAALKKMEIITEVDDEEGSRDWFLYEDQTIGLPVIADLVIQGYSSKQIEKLIGLVSEIRNNESLDPKTDDAVFMLRYNHYNNAGQKFAKACEDVLKEQKAKKLIKKLLTISFISNDQIPELYLLNILDKKNKLSRVGF